MISSFVSPQRGGVLSWWRRMKCSAPAWADRQSHSGIYRFIHSNFDPTKSEDVLSELSMVDFPSLWANGESRVSF